MRFFRYYPLVLLGFFAFSSTGANVCSDCAQEYATVRAQAVVITNKLENLDSQIQTSIYRNQSISSQVANIRNWYSQTGTAVPNSVEVSCRNAEDYVLQNNSTLTSLRDSVSSSYSAALSQLSTLDSFDCSCSSNSCGCVSVLDEILQSVLRIENGTVDYIHSIMLYVEDLPIYLENLNSTSISIYQSLFDLRNKILYPDDDYIADLAYISSQIVQSANLPPSLAFDLASNRLSSDTDRSNIELGIGYLYSAEYQHMLISRRSNETLSDILNVISNISVSVTNSTTGKWEADLAFISNYLYSVQRKYYDIFNDIFYYKSGRPHNPYASIPAYTGITNSWAILRDPSVDRADKLTAFSVLRNSNGTTNWFERIEYALYGIAGFWDSERSFDPSVSQASSVTNNYNRLINATNSFSMVSSVFSVSNQAQTVVSEFKNLVDAFHFPSSSIPSATLTLCPSFQIGDFEFSGIAFEMYDISEVLEAIRTAFQFVWTIGFSFFGIGLAAKFFFYLGKSIRDVFILLKTLL